MREVGDIGQAEHAARPLHGMHRPEQAIDGVVVLGVFLDEQDDGLDFSEQFIGLQTKGLLVELGRVHAVLLVNRVHC